MYPLVLPKTIEYALKILVFLTIFAGRPVSASTVAQRARIPGSQASKILNYLKVRGLTRSRRGSQGGYELRADPEEIRVEKVVELFQPVPEVDPTAPTDPLLKVWSETAGRHWKETGHLTIAELARRIKTHFQLLI